MSALSFAVFDTALGTSAVAWGERGVVRVQLPEESAAKVRGRMRRRLSGATEAPPPPAIQSAIGRIVALLAGEASDLSDVTLDLDRVPDFDRRVYEVARSVPPGATLSYGDVAKRLGDPLLARDVGQALGSNPFPIIVPCHRVLAAGGKIGGFSAPGGVETKRKILAIESAHAKGPPTLFDRT